MAFVHARRAALATMTTSFGHADPQVLYSYCCSCPRLWLQSPTRAIAWRVGRKFAIR